jgi:hypothetical protein
MNTRRKYALVQRLPTGDFWTSLNSEHVGSDAKPLVEANTGYAELVAVLPSASSSKPPPTLGDLHTNKVIQNRFKRLTSQQFSAGSFLDYGPNASFAPTFDSDSGDVGYHGISSILWRRHEKGKAREKARILSERIRMKMAAETQEKEKEGVPVSMEVDDVEEVDSTMAKEAEQAKQKKDQKAMLEKVIGQEGAEGLLMSLESLEREESISELLDKNARAIARLAYLQRDRMRNSKETDNIETPELELGESIFSR